MRASGLVYLLIVGLALAAGCGGEKKPSDEKKDGPAEVAPPKPKPASAVANVQMSEPRKPIGAVDTAAAEKDTAAEAKDTAAAEKDTAGDPDEPGEIELAETEGLGLAELTVARGVEERKPVDPGQRFSLADGKKLYAVMVVSNPEKVESEVTVAWQPDGGKERGGVTVKVGPQPRWRTWAYHSHFKKPGLYYAIVRSAEGQVLGKAPFVITD